MSLNPWIGLTALVGLLPLSWYLWESRQDRKLFGAIHGETKARNLRARAAADWLEESPDTLVLDARPHPHYAKSRLPGAISLHFPLEDRAWNPETLRRQARDTPLFVYCSGGYRSRKAVAALLDLGFTNITNLHRGIGSWRAAGLPLDTTPSTQTSDPPPDDT